MHPSDPKYDRLKLTEERIEEMTWGMQRVSSLETPLAKSWTNGGDPTECSSKK